VSASPLPHQLDRPVLTDGGMETSLIYHDGIDLPAFAAFPLLETPEGREALTRYFAQMRWGNDVETAATAGRDSIPPPACRATAATSASRCRW